MGNKNSVNQLLDCFINRKTKLTKGLGAILLVDLILIITHFSGISENKNLILSRTDPSMISMFTTHYIHANILHLAGNITVFTAFSILMLIIIILTKETTSLFYKLLSFNLLVMPFILSSIWIVSGPRVFESTLGFSGIGASVLGTFTFLWVNDLLRYAKIKVNHGYAFLYIMLYLIFIMTVIYSQYFNMTRITLLMGGWILFYSLYIKDMRYETINTKKPRLAAGFYASCPLLFLSIFSLVLFPTKIGRTDIFTHGMGFFFGLASLYLPANISKYLGLEKS